MPRPDPRRIVSVFIMLACLCLPVAPAHARALDGGIPAALRAGADLFTSFQGFLTRLWTETGMLIDLNGSPGETGMTIDPNGAQGDTGMTIDPDGTP